MNDSTVYRILKGCRQDITMIGIECRKCSRFYCYVAGEQRCCADCPRKLNGTCIEPCLNDPAYCGLELHEVSKSGTINWRK